jgi:hypothetical protein
MAGIAGSKNAVHTEINGDDQSPERIGDDDNGFAAVAVEKRSRNKS